MGAAKEVEKVAKTAGMLSAVFSALNSLASLLGFKKTVAVSEKAQDAVDDAKDKIDAVVTTSKQIGGELEAIKSAGQSIVSKAEKNLKK